MEDERDREGFKYVCKLCNKRYPSGKSLGGHMRSHAIANSKLALAQKNKAPIFVLDDDEDDDGDEDDIEIADQERENGGGHSGYGLRENPKKTWRVVDYGLNNKLQQQQQQNQQQERICKQCGKGFQSLKALCGHMSSHSDKDRNFKAEDDQSWSSESHSDDNPNHFDSLSSKRLTRSSISKYRKSPFTGGGGGGGSSSNISEIDQFEQEEVAMCLIMLSRDSSSHKPCFNLVVAAESSDNNSVILEGGFSSNHGVGIGKRKTDPNLGIDSDKIKQGSLVRSDKDVNVALEMDNSDSGYFENGAKELESDDSNEGFLRNYYNNYGLDKPKVDSGSGLVNSYDDYSKKRVRDAANFSFNSPESEHNSSKKTKQDQFDSNNPPKRSKLECLICKMTFETHQALGSHIVSHRKNGESGFSTTNTKPPYYSSAKNVATSTSKAMLTNNYAKKGGGSGSKKLKGHKCPYCPKVFKSGQALGGHKRSHMMGSGGGGQLRRSPAPPPEPEQKQPMIDLNLPAPVEEEAGGSSHFEASW